LKKASIISDVLDVSMLASKVLSMFPPEVIADELIKIGRLDIIVEFIDELYKMEILDEYIAGILSSMDRDALEKIIKRAKAPRLIVRLWEILDDLYHIEPLDDILEMISENIGKEQILKRIIEEIKNVEIDQITLSTYIDILSFRDVTLARNILNEIGLENILKLVKRTMPMHDFVDMITLAYTIGVADKELAEKLLQRIGIEDIVSMIRETDFPSTMTFLLVMDDILEISENIWEKLISDYRVIEKFKSLIDEETDLTLLVGDAVSLLSPRMKKYLITNIDSKRIIEEIDYLLSVEDYPSLAFTWLTIVKYYAPEAMKTTILKKLTEKNALDKLENALSESMEIFEFMTILYCMHAIDPRRCRKAAKENFDKLYQLLKEARFPEDIIESLLVIDPRLYKSIRERISEDIL